MALRLIHGPLENVNHCAASKASNPNTKKLRIIYFNLFKISAWDKIQNGAIWENSSHQMSLATEWAKNEETEFITDFISMSIIVAKGIDRK